MKNIKYRQRILLETIGKEAIFSQEELMEKLSLQGISATQATLSRDLKALHIKKIPGQGYRLPQIHDSESPSISEGISSLEIAFPLTVIKTHAGFASVVAVCLDRHPDDTIMGSLAGDDTIFLALRKGYSPRKVLAALEKAIPGISSHLVNSIDD